MEALRRIDEMDIELHDVGLRRPTLDDVFLALTGHAAEETRERRSTRRSAMTLAMTLNDGWTITRRNLFAMSRNPEVVIWSTIQPIMFIVLFVYVFGSIPTPGIDYVDYVMAGIFVQTVMFNSALTGVGLARTSRRASSTASGRCRWRDRRCSPDEPPATWSTGSPSSS